MAELISVTPDTSNRLSDLAVGPLVLAGLYCWFDPSNPNDRRAILALHNPTDQDFRVYLGEESGLINANERWYSDHNFRGRGDDCIYEVSIPKSDPRNNQLLVDYEAEFIGVELGEFMPGADAALETLFADLENRDIEAIQAYTEPEASIGRIAALIGWIDRHEPVASNLSRCEIPKFEFAADAEFRPVSWQCEVLVTYAVLGEASSGLWGLDITWNMLDDKFSMALELP